MINFVKVQEWEKTFENLGDTWKFNARKMPPSPLRYSFFKKALTNFY